MATYSSILAWKIPWTEELDGKQSMGVTKELNMAEHTHKMYKCRLMGWDQWLWYSVFIIGEIMYVGGLGSYVKATPSAWFCCSKNKVYFLKKLFPSASWILHFITSFFRKPIWISFFHFSKVARLSMPGVSSQNQGKALYAWNFPTKP